MLKHIPNFLTCCNLLCGCIGIIAAFDHNLMLAAYFIWIGGVFDFFDGFAARLFKGNSELGKQLDSLADVITFGVLPGMIVFHLIKQSDSFNFQLPLEYIALIIPAFSALRLAKFNIDTRQTEDFIGLNTPANAFFFSSFPLLLHNDVLGVSFLLTDYRFLIVVAIVFSFLLLTEIRIFGLKFKDFSWEKNKIRFIFLLSSLLLLIIFKHGAIPLIIILYITLSLIQQLLIKRT